MVNGKSSTPNNVAEKKRPQPAAKAHDSHDMRAMAIESKELTQRQRPSSREYVIALCLQYVLKGYPRKFLNLLTGTPPHLTLNQVSYHSAESAEEIA